MDFDLLLLLMRINISSTHFPPCGVLVFGISYLDAAANSGTTVFCLKNRCASNSGGNNYLNKKRIFDFP